MVACGVVAAVAIGALVVGTGIAAATPTRTDPAAAEHDARLAPPGDTVRVVMTELRPFVEDRDGRPAGFYAEIWSVVAAELGVEVDVLWVDEFGELLTTIDEDRADVAVAPLTPSATRVPDYDFTSSVVASGPQLAYHERIAESAGLLDAVWSPPVRRILLAALAGLLVLAHLIWLVERGRTADGAAGDADGDGNPDGDFSPTYLRGIWDGFWWATVTVTTVGYGDKAPRSVGGRAIALLAMLLSLFLVGAFVSQITEILQAARSEPPVSSLADVDDRPVGVVEGSSFARYVAERGVTTVGFPSQGALLDAAAADEIDLVVSNPFALATAGRDRGLEPVGDVFYTEFEAFGLAKGSPWREPINQVLAELHADGEIDAIIGRWIDR